MSWKHLCEFVPVNRLKAMHIYTSPTSLSTKGMKSINILGTDQSLTSIYPSLLEGTNMPFLKEENELE